VQHDAAKVAAQTGARADIATGTDVYIAYQDGGGVNIGGRIDDWDHALDGIAGHCSVSLGFFLSLI
jgi:hypothetical protein